MKRKRATDPDIVVMREAGTGLKSAWRTQITGAGLGTRLGNSIRLASFPKSGDSLSAAALIWSNTPVIVGAHDSGYRSSTVVADRACWWLKGGWIRKVALGRPSQKPGAACEPCRD